MSKKAPRERHGGAHLGVPLGVLLLAGLLVGLWALSQGTDPRRAIDSSSSTSTHAVSGDGSVTLPEPAGVTSDKPRTLTHGPVASRAAVWAAVKARRRPDATAPVVGTIPTRTPEGTDNILLALEERPDPAGQLWVRVRLAVRPNGIVGWVPRQSLGPYDTLHTRLVIDRNRFRATLYKRGKPIFRARVGLGRPSAPTPQGHFYIRNKLTKYANAFYGPIAFGTSARSPTLTDWPAGGYVGIHGTSRPDLIPGPISHGCIRMRDRDIVRLAQLMQPGTPLNIR